jgi:hypothetical protein
MSNTSAFRIEGLGELASSARSGGVAARRACSALIVCNSLVLVATGVE